MSMRTRVETLSLIALLTLVPGSLLAATVAPADLESGGRGCGAKTSAEIVQAPLLAALEQETRAASSCTNCTACSVNADCGTGYCVSFMMSIRPCEEACVEVCEEVCAPFGSKLCQLSCDPCSTSADCGPSGGSCVMPRLVACLPCTIECHEECGFPDKVCNC